MGGTGDEAAVSVSIRSLPDDEGLRIVDGIERRQCDVFTAGPVDPRPADPSRFPVPLDAVAQIETDELVLPEAATYVREPSGRLVFELDRFGRRSLPGGRYDVELNTPIKLYVRVPGACTLEQEAMSTTLSLSESQPVLVGARSYHERPAATVTTTADPVDGMRAVSTLGSALKTTSPERSFPTLRGHPPEIELGDELSVPDGLERPDTGIRIELPRTHASLLVAAPLAYYLGAEVAPGSEPRIVTDAGFEYDLFDRDFERAVEYVLKQTFFLDCVVRTEGRYPVDLHGRTAVESAVDLDFSTLYDAPPADRLEAYLSVPYDSLEPHVPTWKLTAHVEPTPTSVEAIPFLVDDLAVVRSPSGRSITRSEVQTEAVQDFMHQGPDAEAFTRSASSRSTASDGDAGPSLVRPEDTDSLEQTWLGADAPVGSNKLHPAAFRNRLGRDVTDDRIDIAIVCNDAEMLEEHEDVSRVYGSRDDLSFDVTVHEALGTECLRLVLETDYDFLHYIGHIEAGGFNCPDGLLDATTLDSVAVDSFFLNACQSYDQGMGLIEAGAVGGVVTIDEVINSGAVAVGRTVARLLNRGFPLGAALDIARDRSFVGAQYVVLGDGNVDIAHPESITPQLYEIDPGEGDGFQVGIKTYPNGFASLGSLFKPSIAGNDTHYLTSGHLGEFSVTAGELRDFLELENAPVLFDGQFTWSDDLLDEFRL